MHGSCTYSLTRLLVLQMAPRLVLLTSNLFTAPVPFSPLTNPISSSTMMGKATQKPRSSALHDIRHRVVEEAAALSLPAKKAHRPAARNFLRASVYRPLVAADRRVLLWTSLRGFTLGLQRRIFETLLQAHVAETRESYGAGLLRFHQFCDREGFDEAARMPASRFLLSAFVAQAVGTCSGKAIRGWLSGLRLWHLYNDAPWHGDEGWLPSLKKSADKGGLAFKRPPRGPITPAHLCAFRASLDLESPSGAASWSAATAALWGCRRLGELLIRSVAKFSTLRDTCRSSRVSRSTVNGRIMLSIHLVWTKTTGTTGGEVFLTAVLGTDADLCPVWAWDNHHLTKDSFLRSSSAVFSSAQLDLVLGHSYRIGGSLELLSAGVAPEVVMKLGGWTSLCFLIYWRRL
ncbi:putative tyrosine recombinase [Mycena rebaudengoi]|nr:putative tyrosine recombinase [Mycena rebaudengoi]